MKTLNQTPAAPAQAQHSPLPWRRAGGMFDGYAIVSSDNHAVISQKLPSYNAAFIIRACNNAQRLADALDSLLSLGKAEQFGQWEAWEEVRTAREALAEWSKSR